MKLPIVFASIFVGLVAAFGWLTFPVSEVADEDGRVFRLRTTQPLEVEQPPKRMVWTPTHHIEGSIIEQGETTQSIVFGTASSSLFFYAEGSECDDLHSSMYLAISTAAETYRLAGHTLTVTSCRDEVPGRVFNTLHPQGKAVDLRTKDLDSYGKKLIAAFIRYVLPVNYDVIIERDHIHIEFDPQTKRSPERGK